ncbi:hypothetical protein G4H71_05830 [Rhodococcus triatomae]|uniref:Uncharacterized protein n=1 Tax=Rhodococcus triatomae TaxID=300028 RepID=A0A1G8ANB5_9NOCA|nr:hypothetical protein [Rhodococcus triatomae]QNG17713.1 hypothetical protein G4H72_02215 [Rhodococcus triatomae]QNG22620.1 hypothetical protein G4H71_05830 [Rhodococcus triatomae]SDH22552.1 hypothetical protein SAMN05444695_101489 [Rhodococcus triatomae]
MTSPADTSLLGRYQQHRTRQFLKQEDQFRTWLPGWRTQARRRVLVVVLAATFAFVFAVGVVCLFDMIVGPLLWLVAVAIFLPTWTILQIVSGRQSDAPRDALDEWEIQQRNSARSIGLTVTQVLTIFPAIFLVASAAFESSGRASTYAGGLWVLTTLIIGGCTPAMILAWTRPDPEPEDATER